MWALPRGPGSPDGPGDAQDAGTDADRVITEARSAWRQLAEAADQTGGADAGSSP